LCDEKNKNKTKRARKVVSSNWVLGLGLNFNPTNDFRLEFEEKLASEVCTGFKA
jgi:hypothetical protein